MVVSALVRSVVWLGPEDPLFPFGLPQDFSVGFATSLGGFHDVDWVTPHALSEGVVVTLDGSRGFIPSLAST